MAVMFLLGIVSKAEGILFVFPLIIPLLFILSNRNKYDKKSKLIGISIVFCLISILGGICYELLDSCYSKAYSDYNRENKVTIQGRIYKKEFKNEKYRYYIKLFSSGYWEPSFSALLFMEADEYSISSDIEVSGRVIPVSKKANVGEFDREKYLKSEKIVLSMEASKISLISEPVYPIKDKIYRYKQDMVGFYKMNLPGEESGLLSSMALGDKSLMEEDAGELFRKAGLSHILAISGLHLSVLGAGIYRLLRKRGISFILSGMISVVIVFFYGLLAGNPISLIRATVMFAIKILADIVGHVYDMMTALGVAGIILLIQNPFVIYNSGFILSFVAILGICILAEPIGGFLETLMGLRWESIYKKDRGKHFVPTWIERTLLAIFFGLSVSAFTYPVVAVMFNEIPIYVIFLNLLIIPFLAILLICGLVGGLIFWEAPLIICHFIIYYYEMMADFVSSIPGASLIIATPGPVVMGIYYCVLFLISAFVARKIRAERSGSNKNIQRISYILGRTPYEGKVLRIVKKKNPEGYRKYRHISGYIRMFCISFSLIVLSLIGLLKSERPDGFRIDMLYVGQGDGIFIQSEENVSFFVDGGSTSKSQVGKYTILPYLKAAGVSGVDYWFLTHLDEDHISGFLEILESGYQVKNLILSKSVVKSEVFSEIENLCKSNNTRIHYLIPGDCIGTKSMSITVLYPSYPPKSEDPNENSLVFLLKYGEFEGIFTGDMGIDQEKELMDSSLYKKLIEGRDIELLKVAHHGSKNSSSEEFIKSLSPEIALISVGENSRYGHPHRETLERFIKLVPDVRIYRTDECGQITVKENSEKGSLVLSYL